MDNLFNLCDFNVSGVQICTEPTSPTPTPPVLSENFEEYSGEETTLTNFVGFTTVYGLFNSLEVPYDDIPLSVFSIEEAFFPENGNTNKYLKLQADYFVKDPETGEPLVTYIDPQTGESIETQLVETGIFASLEITQDLIGVPLEFSIVLKRPIENAVFDSEDNTSGGFYAAFIPEVGFIRFINTAPLKNLSKDFWTRIKSGSEVLPEGSLGKELRVGVFLFQRNLAPTGILIDNILVKKVETADLVVEDGNFDNDSKVLTITVRNIGVNATTGFNGKDWHPIVPVTENIEESTDYKTVPAGTPYYTSQGVVYLKQQGETLGILPSQDELEVEVLETDYATEPTIVAGTDSSDGSTYSLAINPVAEPETFITLQVNLSSLPNGKYMFSADDIVANYTTGNTIETVDNDANPSNNYFVFDVSGQDEDECEEEGED